MFYLYLNQELIAVSNTFNEIADIFIVECLNIDKSDHYRYQMLYLLFTAYCYSERDLGYREHCFLAPDEDCIFEVFYDGKRS